MGRHQNPGDAPTERIRMRHGRAQAVNGGDRKPLQPNLVLTLIVLGVVFVFVLISSVIAEMRDSSNAASTSSPSTEATDEPSNLSSYATQGWNTEANKQAFVARLNVYGSQYGQRYAPATNGIGIRNCMYMRAERPALLYGRDDKTKPVGLAWAINKAAIDVYCPDQEGYRDFVQP